jgi:hypothetical protein
MNHQRGGAKREDQKGPNQVDGSTDEWETFKSGS